MRTEMREKPDTRAELLAASGAVPEDLAAVEAEGLLVPHRSRWPWTRREAWYTEAQLGVLRWLLVNRRLAARRHGARAAAPADVDRAGPEPAAPGG